MKNKVFSMALAALAALFLAVSPVAAEDLSAAGPVDLLRAVYQTLLEWCGELSESTADAPQADGNERTGENPGVADPEVAPYIPPGG